MVYNWLTSFLKVADLQSFSRAAEKVYRTQTAVSTQVRLLEKECGRKLFDRGRRKVQLTPAGEILRDYAQRMFNLHEEALRAIAELKRNPKGKLHIGANDATCLYVLPRTFAQFKRLYPSVQIAIYRNFSYKILQKVIEGAVDMGIVTLPQPASNMEVIPVFRDELQVVVPKNHPLTKKRATTIEEISHYPLLIPKTGRTRALLDRLLRKHRHHLMISMELTGIETIKKFVGAGLGISLICRTYARTEIAAGLLKVIPLVGQEIDLELGLIYRRDRCLSHPAELFIDFVRKSTHLFDSGSMLSKNMQAACQ